VREPSQSEVTRRVARSAVDESAAQTILPGIIKSYDPALCEVEAIPAIFADDETAPSEPYTCPLRVWRVGGFGVGAGPVPGDHCTLIFHGLDPSAFFAAPGAPARAELTRKGGVYPEAWPALYGPAGPTPGVLWMGTGDWLSKGIAITPAAVQLGGLTAIEPVPLGLTLTAYIAALYAWCNLPGLVGIAGSPPPPPVPFISTSVLVSP
jgi:hypothetical protein